MICLVHFHLINPIMVAKKKTQDVQCYAEVMDSVQTLDAGRRSMYDPDEIEEEQREREQRNKVYCPGRFAALSATGCKSQAFCIVTPAPSSFVPDHASCIVIPVWAPSRLQVTFMLCTEIHQKGSFCVHWQRFSAGS